MSNVLIGIIGVILFIGLALAGALFLGPRFQEATLNSKASAAVQMASQTAHAANLYRLNSGTDALAANTLKETLVDTGYMKSVPSSIRLIDAAGITASGNAAATVLNDLGTDDMARSLCEVVEKQMGRDSLDGSNRGFSLTTLRSNTGCKFNGVNYFVFAKL